jgi:tetratricopeptide (TPR) repeat protein
MKRNEKESMATLRRCLIVAVAFLFTVACAHKVPTKSVALPPLPSGPSEDELAFQDGLKAFRLATPEGYQRAAASFRKASELNKSKCEYVLHLAEALYFLAQQQKANWEEFGGSVGEANAIVFFNKDAPRCRPYPSYLSRLQSLEMLFENGRAADSIARIKQAIDLDPADPMNWVVLAQLRPLPEPGGSLAPIEHAADLAPDLPLVNYELGNLYLRNQNTFSKAREAFDRTLDGSPRHFQALIGIVYSLSSQGDDAADQVEQLLRRAVEIAPKSLKARSLLGDFYAGIEETELAVEQYKAAIASNAKYYPAFLSAGIALAAVDQSAEAESYFDTVIALDVKRPHPPFNGVDFGADAQAHYYLGNIWLDRGDLATARKEYEETLNDVTNYPGALYGMGIVSYREGKVDDALAFLNKVIEIDAVHFPNAYLARGSIRAERRQFKDALSDFNQSIEIYKQEAAALEVKAQLDEVKGLKRRAEGERRRKAVIEATLEKALESKKAVEALLGIVQISPLCEGVRLRVVFQVTDGSVK